MVKLFTLLILITFQVHYQQCEVIPITEEIKNGTVIDSLSKLLKTYLPKVSGYIRPIEDKQLYRCLSVDSNTGTVTVKQRIDREALCKDNTKVCSVQMKFFINPGFHSISVEIKIIDINDNPPCWHQKIINLDVTEFDGNKFESRYIHVDKAYDLDMNENSQISYYLKDEGGQKDNSDFKIVNELDSNSRLTLTPTKIIDREEKDSYNMVLVAVDNGLPKLTGFLTIRINVLDKNDNAPTFDKAQYRNDALSESAEIGFVVLSFSVTDKDAGANGQITYRIDDRLATSYFSVDSEGRLKVRNKLDYDNGIRSFRFPIIAVDNAPEVYRKTGEADVIINLKDENDEKPQIFVHVTTVDPVTKLPAVKENELTPNFVMAHVEVKDDDNGGNDRIVCSLKENSKVRLEPILLNEFQIVALKSFDRESESQETVEIECADQANNRATKTISFQVLDENDNTPEFRRSFSFRVKENSSDPYLYVGKILAVDLDSGRNSEVEYEIIGKESEYFNVDKKGIITTRRVLDREEIANFSLTVLAKDLGEPSKTGTGQVHIDVIDVNDWAPQFSSQIYEFSIAEGARQGDILGYVNATDKDLPANTYMNYRIQSSTSNRIPFKIRSLTGAIYTSFNLDREEQSFYSLIIIAIDNGRPQSFTSSATVKITILDINDNAPVFTTKNFTKYTLGPKTSIGDEIVEVVATDADFGLNSSIDYDIVGGNSNKYFSLNSRTGKLIVGYLNPGPGEYNLVILACDQGQPRKCSLPLSIFVKVTTVLHQNSNENYTDVPTDSKTYIFIICVLIILLMIIFILIICIILFRNKLCDRINQHSRSDSGSGDMKPNDIKQSHQLLNINQEGTYPIRTQYQNSEFNIPHRERQLSSEYQSIEGGTPSYQPIATQFFADIQEPIYAGPRSMHNYYYPNPAGGYSHQNTSNLHPQRMMSSNYGTRINGSYREPNDVQEMLLRTNPQRRSNSLLNFQIPNQSEEKYNYKSLQKSKPKASFV